MRAIDCQSFAGGFTLGASLAGWDVIAKREQPGGFGARSVMDNQYLVNDNGLDYEEGPWQEWTPEPVELVFGNPPCSGFSLLSSGHWRGVGSPANACMWALVQYAARCQPRAVAFESVQGAFKTGRPLMQALREKMEEDTGRRFNLTHVLQNAYYLGGAAQRRRYFFVLTEDEFGVDWAPPERYPTLRDVIGDLEPLEAWSPGFKRYPAETVPSWWASTLRSGAGGTDAHCTRFTPGMRRALDLTDAENPWPEGEAIDRVAKAYWERNGRLPPSWSGHEERLVKTDFTMGFFCIHSWRYDGPTRVITGAAPDMILHPRLPRPLTNRECLRIQGFPDDWAAGQFFDGSDRHVSGASSWWGKGIPVEAGEWIATELAHAVEGHPGSIRGELIGDRERVIDVTSPQRFERAHGKRDLRQLLSA